MTIDTFSAQASALVSENRRLRIKSDNDDRTITTLKAQYAELSDDFKLFQRRCQQREHELITERDQAVCAHSEMEGLLNQAADLIVQAMARRNGIATITRPAGDAPSSALLTDDDGIEYYGYAEGRLKKLMAQASGDDGVSGE